MFTRKDYMDGKCTHRQYYEDIAKEAGISYDKCIDLSDIRKKLKTDKHLNNISLKIWDDRGLLTKGEVSMAMSKRGDFWTLAGSVCTHKAAAKKSARKEGTRK